MSTNPLVSFLASYGPQPSSNNLYDEFVVEASKKTGCEPLQIEQPLIDELTQLLQSDAPKSVILTGTAGDGKTYTARQVAENLSDVGKTWTNTQKVFELPNRTKSGHRVRFIKDLSELNDSDKDAIFEDVRSSLAGSSSELFVICVNDGHLLKFFRERDPEIQQKIAEMLQDDREVDATLNFRLINMSRQSHQRLVDQIINGVVNHSSWSDCTGCPAFSSVENPCPIQRNRSVLAKTEAASMRSRLKDMIRMSAADGRHLSIRQLILLTVNTLLGDRKPSSTLLSCSKAKNRARENEYDLTNPYANVFGDNLTEKQRSQYGAFAVLNEFQVGFETNNYFDHGLLWETNDLPVCGLYGERVFESPRKRYRADPARYAAEFQRKMVDQRRRLFFSLDPMSDKVKSEPRRNPWNLSVFKHGATYIGLVDVLLSKPSAPPPEFIDTRKKLFRGLNRMMTGEMTTTDDKIWITEPSGVYLGREIPLLVQHAAPLGAGSPTTASFPRPDDVGKAPVLKVLPNGSKPNAVELPLRPTLVECLLRIAEGALPASFSSETRKEVERFQLRFAAALNEASEGAISFPKEIDMERGALREKQVSIMSSEEVW